TEARGGRNPNPNAPFVAVTNNGQLLPEVKQALAVIAKKQFHSCIRTRSCGGSAARVSRGESSGRAAADRDTRGGPDGQDDVGSDEGSRETRRVDRVQLQKHARGQPYGLDPRRRTRALLPVRVLDEKPATQGVRRSRRRRCIRSRDEEAWVHRA